MVSLNRRRLRTSSISSSHTSQSKHRSGGLSRLRFKPEVVLSAVAARRQSASKEPGPTAAQREATDLEELGDTHDGLRKHIQLKEEEAVVTAPEVSLHVELKSRRARLRKREHNSQAAESGTQPKDICHGSAGDGVEELEGPPPISAHDTDPLFQSSGRPSIQISTFRPSQQILRVRTHGSVLELRLEEGSKLVVLGDYGIRIISGEILVYGAALRSGHDINWVHAPTCHAVPFLRSTEDSVIELHSTPVSNGLQQLDKLSPMYRKLWHEPTISGPQAESLPDFIGSFRLICTSDDVGKDASVQLLTPPPEWNRAMAIVVDNFVQSQTLPRVLVCGPKSSGKSTFIRLLGNKLITLGSDVHSQAKSQISILDMDPGQPEFGPAGFVSLVQCRRPVLGPPFAHPLDDGVVFMTSRSHALTALTPAADPQHYMECIADLFSTYQRTSSDCPLIINSPGWIQGTGLDVLVGLIKAMQPDRVIYMSTNGPVDAVRALGEAAQGRLYTVPSQSTGLRSRTPSQLRSMQLMSHFHARPHATYPRLDWDSTPLSAMRPWDVSYTSREAGILGIMCYDSQPTTDLVAELINGLMLSIVEVERWSAFDRLPRRSCADDEMELDPDYVDTNGDPLLILPAAMLSYSPEGIPLVRNPDCVTVDPRHSRALGLALVRGIDAPRHRLQLLTPVAEGRIRASWAAGHALLLVLGGLRSPNWAYLEGCIVSDVVGEDDLLSDEDASGTESDEVPKAPDEGPGSNHSQATRNVPWVEAVEHERKRLAGSKSWRPRRDLG